MSKYCQLGNKEAEDIPCMRWHCGSHSQVTRACLAGYTGHFSWTVPVSWGKQPPWFLCHIQSLWLTCGHWALMVKLHLLPKFRVCIPWFSQRQRTIDEKHNNSLVVTEYWCSSFTFCQSSWSARFHLLNNMLLRSPWSPKQQRTIDEMLHFRFLSTFKTSCVPDVGSCANAVFNENAFSLPRILPTHVIWTGIQFISVKPRKTVPENSSANIEIRRSIPQMDPICLRLRLRLRLLHVFSLCFHVHLFSIHVHVQFRLFGFVHPRNVCACTTGPNIKWQMSNCQMTKLQQNATGQCDGKESCVCKQLIVNDFSLSSLSVLPPLWSSSASGQINNAHLVKTAAERH